MPCPPCLHSRASLPPGASTPVLHLSLLLRREEEPELAAQCSAAMARVWPERGRKLYEYEMVCGGCCAGGRMVLLWARSALFLPS